MLPCSCKRCDPARPRFKFPKTITSGRLNFLSVSQVETFDATTPYGCERKWGWSKLHGLREPQTKAQEVGNEVHEQLQHFESTGQDLLGPIPRAGKHFVHGPGPGLLVEHEELGAVSVAGVPFYVRMDLQNSGDYWLDDDGERRALDCVEVVDHKTSSDIKAWAKSGRELLKTTQMVVYGAYALRDGTSPKVRLSHCYYGTRKREALKSSAVATRQEVEDRLGHVATIVERMKVAAGASSAADLEPDYSKCGRCAHVAICPRPASAQFLAIYALTGVPSGPNLTTGGEQKMPTVLELLKMKKSEPVAPAATPTPAPAPVAPPAPAASALDPAAVNARVAELEAQLAAAKSGAPAPNVTLTGDDARKVVPDLPPHSAVLTSAAIAAAAGVLPPDAPKSGTSAPAADPIPEATLATMSPAIQAAHAEVMSTTHHDPNDSPAYSASGVPLNANAVAEAASAPSAKKTRAKKAAEPEVVTYDPASVASGPKDGGVIQQVTGPLGTGVIITIDAAVSGIEAKSLDSYVDGILAGICETARTFDVRVAPNKDSVLAYGAWKGIVRSRVTASPPPPGVYTLRVGSCEVREEVAWGLQAIPGAVVVRGVR